MRKPKWCGAEVPRSGQIALPRLRGFAECPRAAVRGNAVEETGDELLTYSESEWTMSRRPNKRESTEKAPGPRRKSEVITQNEKAN